MKAIFKKSVGILLSVIMLATSFVCIGNVFAEDTDVLAGKTLLFAGDSISAGYKDEANADSNLKAWAKRLADGYGMQVTLAAQSGSPLSTIREPDRPAIVNQLHANKGTSFDYIVLQGGVNDAMGTATDNSKEAAAPVGEMSNSFVNYAFDTSTFAGALENLFYYAKSYFPEAKVGYIITFATPLSTHGGYTADTDSMRLYWNMAKAICEKWGVSYLDLFDGTTEDGQSYSYDILKVDTATNFYGGGYDYIHLNSMGYDLTAPYVAKWLPTTTAITYDDSSETFQGGSGTEADPYIITNETELALAITNGGEGERFFGCHFSIANDIYLNDIEAADWKTGTANAGYTLKPWYVQDETFAGTIDGNGHTVYGLYSYADGTIKWSNNTIGSGLIPATDSTGTATIKNLGVDYSFIRQRFCAGAFVGVCGKEVVIDNCFVGSNTKVIGCHAGAMVGNGYQKTVTITNSYSLAEFEVQTANDYSYGLIGYANQAKATVDNCYIVNGPITSTGGTNDNSVFKFSSSYQTADSGSGGSQSEHTDIYTLTADNMQGEDVFTNESKMPNLNTTDAYMAQDNNYPILKKFYVAPPSSDDSEIIVWDGTTQKAPSDSNNDGIYEITNAAELAYVIDNNGTINNTPACSFILTDDIYINDPSKVNWETGAALDAEYTINSWFRYWKTGDIYHEFAGTIEGDGHTVYGLYFNMPNEGLQQYDAAALIPGVLGNVTIKNLAVDKAYVNYTNGVSAFVGYAHTDSTINITNSFAGADVTLKGNDAGVFRAVARDNINCVLENCYSLATTTGVATHGLIGYNWDERGKFAFKNCYNAKGPLNFGGAPGYHCTAENSYSTEDNVNANGGNWLNIGSNWIAADKMQGLDVFTDASKMPNLNTTDAYMAQDNNYPILKKFYVAPPSSDDSEIIVWDGTVAECFASGNGTETNPYLISNGSELALAITQSGTTTATNAETGEEETVNEDYFGKHFKLTNDIYLNEIDAVDWKAQTGLEQSTLKPWYSQDETFAGTINGNGHTVYGLYSYAGGTIKFMNLTIGSGLIPATDSAGTATIKNLGIDYSYVRQRYCAGAFVGLCGKSVVIDNCFVGPNTKIIGCHAGAIVGNGYQKTVTITNSYSLAEFEVQTANDYSYGLIGYANQAKATVDNCYIVNGPITSTGDTNDNSVFKFSSSYQTADSGSGGSQSEHTDIYTLTADSMQGEDVFTNESKMPCLNSDNAYLATKGYPILISFNKGDVLEGPWDGSIEKPTALDGNGNILISTAAELAYVIKNGGGASYVLSNDIYLNDISAINWYTGEVAKGYTPAKWYTTDTSTAFTGTIDGKGYVVYGLYFANGTPAPTGSENYTCDAVALIPRMSDNGTSTVKNLGIDYAYIKGSQCAAAFVGNSNGAALKTVDSCFAGEKVTVIGHVAGGIFGGGDSELSVNNCYSLATLGATYSSGGFFGNVWSYNYTINEEETYTKQTVNNSYSFNFRPFTVTDGVVAENVYTNVSVTCDYYSVLTDDNMTGADAFENMGGFDGKIWYAVNNGQTTPLLRVHGTAVGDVDEDGVGKRAGDILALRTTIIGAQSYLNTDYNGNGETDICDLVKLNNDGCKDKESSVIKNKLEIPLNINTYRDASGSIGETITISGPTGPWNYASFNVETGATYGVKFYAYPSAESWPHIFLCNGEDVILNTISAEYAGRNYITFTVTDNQITKVYVRSRTNNGEKEKIKVTQNIEGIDLVNMDILGQLKFEIAPPKNYTAWPMVEEVNGKLVCLYTEADQHSFTECKLYMKTSSTNGLTWSEAKEIITEDSGARGITGTGNDSQGNMLIWYMNRNKDWSTKHTLYKTDGNTVTKVCAPDFSFTGGGHIGNIFSVPGEGLFAFYNTYGNTRSWGVVKSVDDGLTWEQIPVEENIESAECPVEIDGLYHNGKILALGRKDKNSGTIAMFQIQSSDNGANWTKEYTNITEDALGNSPSIIFDGETEDIYMYYFDRNTGKLKRRTATFTGVWDNPAGWSEATVIVSEPYSGQDTGNVKTVEINGMHFATYYVGTATDTGVYGLLIKP